MIKIFFFFFYIYIYIGTRNDFVAGKVVDQTVRSYSTRP